mmetsp:Transcript_15269/g.18086  ORF Transcript_15269/g.18086 Transcript_15269/m.18086 type:complete len:341 (+) Transcript_15269:130-1152(+)
MLQNILPQAKRKVENSIIFLSSESSSKKYHSSVNDASDMAFFEAGLAVIRPWSGVLDKGVLHRIVLDCLVPRLARHLSRIEIKHEIGTKCDDNGGVWASVNLLFRLYDDGLLPSREFLSLVEGELLLRIAGIFHGWLVNRIIDVERAAELYVRWKLLFLSGAIDNTTSATLSQIALREDNIVCRIFYGCLLMIKAAANGSEKRDDNDDLTLDELEPALHEVTNYKIVQARRTKEDRMRDEENEMAGCSIDPTGSTNNNSTKAHTSSFHGKRGVTFKDVVEEVAQHNDIPFYPKIGPASTKDGKVIFILGEDQIYLDSNVVYVYRGTDWHATSLEKLVSSL